MPNDAPAGDAPTGGSVDGSGLPWRSPAFHVILAVALVVPLDIPYLSPVLPAIADAFVVSGARAGLVLTAFAGPGVVFTIVFGVLADRVGRRRVLVPCLALYGLFGAAIAGAGSFDQVVALRALQGVFGGGVLASLALTLVGDFFSGTRRNAVMGATSAVMALGAAAYPAVGGVLAAGSWRHPFLLYGLAIVAALVALLWLRESGGEGIGGLAYLRAAATALPARTAVALYGAAFAAATAVFGGLLAGVPFLLSEAYGLGSGPIGTLLTLPLLATALVSFANGRLARRASEGALIGAGFLGYGVGFAGTWLAETPVAVAVALAVFGVGNGLVLPSIPSALSRISPARFRAGVLSLRTSLLLVGQTIGPLLFTVPAVTVGYAVPLLVAGSLLGVAGLSGLAVLSRRRPGGWKR